MRKSSNNTEDTKQNKTKIITGEIQACKYN